MEASTLAVSRGRAPSRWRRRLSLSVLAFVLASVLVVDTSTPANAFVGPAVPIVAAAVGADLTAATGIGLVGLGAWYAWSHRGQIMSWLDGRTGVTVGGTGSLSAFIAWTGTPPQVWSTSNNTLPYTVTQLTGGYHKYKPYVDCYNPQSGLATYSMIGGGINSYGPGEVHSFDVSANCQAPAAARTVRVTDDNGNEELIWQAPPPGSNVREVRSRVVCVLNGTATSYTSPSVTMTTSSVSAGSFSLPSCNDVVAGSHMESFVIEDRQSGSTGAWSTVLSRSMPSSQTGASSPYAQCIYSSGDTPCQLGVYYGGSICAVGVAACADWFTRSATDSGYTCRWGPYTVALDSCAMLRYQYDPNQGPDSQTDPGIATAPVAASPAPSPVVGTPGYGTTLNPDGTTTQTQTQLMPDGTTRTVRTTLNTDGSKTTVTSYANPDGSPASTPTTTVTTPGPGSGTATDTGHTGNGCSGSFSWNPVDWVENPVKCALRWAFVPSDASMAQLQTLATTFAGKAPMGYATAAVNWLGTAFPSGDCRTAVVVAFDFPVFGHVVVLDTSSPDGVWQAFQTFRPVLEVCLYVTIALGLAVFMWRKYAPGSAGNA